MLTAHAPAGYIIAKLLSPLKPPSISSKKWAIYGVLGGLLPDVDMLWFYLVDNRQVHHHRYFTHFPIVWFSLLLLSYFLYKNRQNSVTACALLLSINACVHMLLDSIVGDIWWLMPFYDRAFSLFTVPAVYPVSSWHWNFILHWTFAFEVAIWVWAIWLVMRKSYVSAV